MKPTHILMLAGIILISPTVSHAQVAGTTILGVSVAEMREVALGWSVKHTILGQHVYNDKMNASERSMTSSSLQIRRFHTPSLMSAAFLAWRSTMSPSPFLSLSWSIKS